MVLDVQSGQHVLVLWGSGSSPGTLEGYVAELQKAVTSAGRVQVENIERLAMCKSTMMSLYALAA